MSTDTPIRVTQHAIEAYGINHKGPVDVEILTNEIRAGIQVSEDLGRTLVGRPWTNTKHQPTTYVMSTDRSGLFALAPRDGELVAVTYLRFQESQRRFALTHWPIESPTSAAREDPATGVGRPKVPDPASTIRRWMQSRLREAAFDATSEVTTLFRDYRAWAVINGLKTSKEEVWRATMESTYQSLGDRFAGVRILRETTPQAERRCAHCGQIDRTHFEVHPEVLTAAGVSGSIHIWCLEQRLGRDLTLGDLTDDPVNDTIFFGFRMARAEQARRQRDQAQPYRLVQVAGTLRRWVESRVTPDEDARAGVLSSYEDYERFCRGEGRTAIPFDAFRDQMVGLVGAEIREGGNLHYRARLHE